MSRQRNKPLNRAIAVYHSFCNGELDAHQGFQQLIYAELEPVERVILYHLIAKPDTTGAEIAGSEAMSLVHVDTVLKRLFDLGLIDRKLIADAKGRYFLYRAKEWGKWIEKG